MHRNAPDLGINMSSQSHYTLHVIFRFDPAEMLCAVFWESSYSDMLVYILCAFSISIFIPFLLIISCTILTCAGHGKDCSRFVELETVNHRMLKLFIWIFTGIFHSKIKILLKMSSPSIHSRVCFIVREMYYYIICSPMDSLQ